MYLYLLLLTLSTFVPQIPHAVLCFVALVFMSRCLSSNVSGKTEWDVVTSGKIPYICNFLHHECISWNGKLVRIYVMFLAILHRILKTGYTDLHMVALVLVIVFTIGRNSPLHLSCVALFGFFGLQYVIHYGITACILLSLNLAIFILMWIMERGRPAFWSAIVEYPLLLFLVPF